LKALRVLHVIPSIAEVHGGPSVAVAAMAGAIASRGLCVTVATTDDAGPGHRMSRADQAAQHARFKALGVRLAFARKETEFYKVSIGLARWLGRHVGDYDVVHIHALFSFASIAAARIARRGGVPYVVRPLGVLDRYGMTRRRPALKGMSYAVLDGPALRGAAAVHFTSTAEREAASRLVDPVRAVVIPLGVAAPDRADPSSLLHEIAVPEGRPRLLFLSRLDPKKNLEGLLRAIAVLVHGDRRPLLLIAGGGDADYVSGLRRLAKELGVADSIAWLGPVAGSRKDAAWAAADLFVLPSHSENFGIAAAEAMLAGLPCVLGEGVAMAVEASAAGAAVLTSAEPCDIADRIDALLGDRAEAAAIGARARSYAGDHFTTEIMGERLEALYRQVVSPQVECSVGSRATRRPRR
jgi:glycosyltransferase involved in cell wall biosynthesis